MNPTTLPQHISLVSGPHRVGTVDWVLTRTATDGTYAVDAATLPAGLAAWNACEGGDQYHAWYTTVRVCDDRDIAFRVLLAAHHNDGVALDAVCHVAGPDGYDVALPQNLEVLRDWMHTHGGSEWDREWTGLPSYGGSEPDDTSEIWSWDETRLLVGASGDQLEIVSRSERLAQS